MQIFLQISVILLIQIPSHNYVFSNEAVQSFVSAKYSKITALRSDTLKTIYCTGVADVENKTALFVGVMTEPS